MKEEIFVSGRNIPNIDPFLNIWHWQIPMYLYLGGIAAGILFFAGLFTLLGKEKEMPATIKWAPIIAPFALVLGLFFLFLDLKHKIWFWQLYTTMRFESPMSWGAWVLMAITPLSMVWVGSYMKELFPAWNWKFRLLEAFEGWAIKNRTNMAWVMVVLAVILGIYTGILLSAFNARPLWNNLLIVIEIFFIFHMIMGFRAGSAVQIDAAGLFVGGPFTITFWVFVVLLGLLFPALLETLELRGFKVPVIIPAILILLGGLMFRFIMVEAGQITRYLY
jgi:protein NrfD